VALQDRIDMIVCRSTTIFVIGLLALGAPAAGDAWAQASDELEIEGKVDAIDLGAEAAHKKNVDGMIAELTPEIDSGRLSATELVRALRLRCWAHFEKGNLEPALADCNRVLADDPDDGSALVLRAGVRIRQQQFAAAIGDLDHAIAAGGLDDEQLAMAYLRRGIVRQAMGDGRSAAADVQQAVALDSKLANAYHEVSEAMLGRGKGAAPQSFEQAMGLDPKSAVSYVDRGLGRLGRGQFDAAVEDFNRALEIDPYAAAAFHHRGEARFYQGRSEDALADFARALDLDPRVAPIVKSRALVEFNLGRFDAAARDFAAAARADAADAYAALWLFLARHRAGAEAKATESALRQQMSTLDATKWPRPVIRFYVGETDEAPLRTAAGTNDGADGKRRLCDVAFYAGERALLAGDAATARARLTEAASACPIATAESVIARTELSRLPP
jgi:lipoprotein NlpI